MNLRAANIGGGQASGRRAYKYYDLVMAVFVTVLLCSNLIGPGKVCGFQLPVSIFPSWTKEDGFKFTSWLAFGAGNLFFPISYIFGDVLTEVYGYARTRRVIWAGFGALIFSAIMGLVVIHFPAYPHEEFNKTIQPALVTVFGGTWQIVLGSMLAFWAGDFANSYVMAKMKIMTKGRWLWTRTIGSTIVGQLVDCIISYPIAFLNKWGPGTMINVIIFNWLFKVSVEVVFTPITYIVVNFLKRAEQEDFYDVKTNFTPFSLAD